MIGDLKEFISITEPTPVGDAGGGESRPHELVARVPAQSISRSAGTDRTLGVPIRVRRRRFIIRYREGMNFAHRIEHRGQTYRITDIQVDDDRRRYLLIDGQELS